MYVLKTCAACTMVLGLLFVTVFVLSDAAAMKKQAYFNRTAYLPCHPTKAQNMSLSELIVFWQDQKKSVLYEHYFGREKLDNVNAKYLNRTNFDGENWTLGLHNVQIKDMGLYDCFIQKNTPKGLVIVQQTYTELSVVANFSEPKIEVQYKDRNSGINLTCSSKQGFPKPTKMYVWIINSTNSTNEYSDEMLISQDNVTELFSVSINLSIPFPDDVWSVTAVCVLETKSMTTSSTPQDIGKAASQDDLFHGELDGKHFSPTSQCSLLAGKPSGRPLERTQIEGFCYPCMSLSPRIYKSGLNPENDPDFGVILG